MKKILKTSGLLFAMTLMMAMLQSCNSDGEYVAHDGTICHAYWTFSFGTVYDSLPEVDPGKFDNITDWAGKDDRHVYFKAILIPGADPATVQAKKYPLICDKRDYYYKGVPLHVASVKNFEVVNWNEDDIWAIDGKYAFYDTVRIEPKDIKTFKIQCYNVAVDSEHVYRYGKILPLADPKTYVEEWKGFYSRDKAHIWYMGDLMTDVDYATFTIDDDGAHDKNGHFYRGERVSENRWKELKEQEK